MKRYHSYGDIPQDLLASLKEKVDQSPYRQNFHVEGDMGFINDPNGVSYFDGKYHLFYQWSPLAYSQESWFQGWYHLSSEDLVHWRDEGIGIEPSTIYETHGAYSGSALKIEDKLLLFYTGNTRLEDNSRVPYQIMAEMDGKGVITKQLPPALSGYPEGYTAHFRDPKLWKDKLNGDYYAVIGAQRESLTGTALLLHSEDLSNWKVVGEVATKYSDFGYMWECPNYFEIGDKGVLLFSPQGLEAEPGRYENIYQTGYIVGNRIDKENTCLSLQNEFQELDRGFDFYAAQVLQYQGRTILFAWMGLPEIAYPTEAYAYCGCLTLPRELFLEDGKLKQRPLPELKMARSQEFLTVKRQLQSCVVAYDLAFGIELDLRIKNANAKKVIIDIAANRSREAYTRLIVDYEEETVVLDRLLSGQPLALDYGSRRLISKTVLSETQMTLFLDRSSLELFFNDGEAVASSRIFPEEDQTHFFVESIDGEAEIDILGWRLKVN